jgi:hypothetical protein
MTADNYDGGVHHDRFFAQPDDDARPVSCGNCAWTGTVDGCREVRDLLTRVEPGETMPAGECPECGALAHLDDAEADDDPHALGCPAASGEGWPCRCHKNAKD